MIHYSHKHIASMNCSHLICSDLHGILLMFNCPFCMLKQVMFLLICIKIKKITIIMGHMY